MIIIKNLQKTDFDHNYRDVLVTFALDQAQKFVINLNININLPIING